MPSAFAHSPTRRLARLRRERTLGDLSRLSLLGWTLVRSHRPQLAAGVGCLLCGLTQLIGVLEAIGSQYGLRISISHELGIHKHVTDEYISQELAKAVPVDHIPFQVHVPAFNELPVPRRGQTSNRILTRIGRVAAQVPHSVDVARDADVDRVTIDRPDNRS